RRVKRLDAAAEHLRDSGQVFDTLDVESDLPLEEVRRAAACDELPAELGQPACELLQPALVVTAQECSHSSLTTSGSKRCSTAWIRCKSVSRGSTGTDSWRITPPESMPSST